MVENYKRKKAMLLIEFKERNSAMFGAYWKSFLAETEGRIWSRHEHSGVIQD